MTTQSEQIDLKELTDLIYVKERAIESATKEVKELKSQLLHEMVGQGKKKVEGTEGAYQTSTSTRYQYGPQVTQFIRERGLADHFISVTRKALDSLLKDGTLSYEDMGYIERHTTPTQEYVIRKCVNKSAVEELTRG